MVYQLLNENGLCNYYELNQNPGFAQQEPSFKNKFAYLDDAAIAQQLIVYKDDEQTHIVFYLPHMHCSSCLYLLENLSKINKGIIRSTVQFARKEVEIIFRQDDISLRRVAELLTQVGYEPYISLQDLNAVKPRLPKHLIYQLGVAGFSFANIMLMSFPEYLGLEKNDALLQQAFRYLNLFLALPVLLYSAQPFYQSAWKSLQHRFLNIDAPIVLAIWVTFTRSVIEIVTGTGSGYFDSFAGIVFFMLIGRVLQDKTYQQLSFDRDYTAYFPIAVTVIKDQKEQPTALPDVKPGDTLRIHQDELIPVDGILTRGTAYIDYSFVTGESVPVVKEMGEIVYAGGKQTNGAIELLSIKEVAQSYLTRLWNQSGKAQVADTEKHSFVHRVSQYFTYIVFAVAAVTALWWATHDPSKIWPSVTAILIIACPCALLLSNSFTNGNILRIFSRNGLYLRNADTIEKMASVTELVFDKTGTLTTAAKHQIQFEGVPLNKTDREAVAAIAGNSRHPLSKAIANELGRSSINTTSFCEHIGKGLEGWIDDHHFKIGSQLFVTGKKTTSTGTRVYLSKDNQTLGYFAFSNYYRHEIGQLFKRLQQDYKLAVLSGDNEAELQHLIQLTKGKAVLKFNQQPEQKRNFIAQEQANGKKLMMIGDGLNDAVALQESTVGIAIAENSNTFTPASDGILQATTLVKLYHLLQLAKANKQIVMASFVMSIIYNLIGLYFAVQGTLSPLVAAILMPSSSISIIVLTYGASSLLAKRWKL